ncbi:MAG TPA: DHA2 family efflux MFS transporter permease subunit [Stellaceae bacterium]|jgi:DHA2 family multidrug resistance protein|nr:DHA2 family efflux MFS transporter permease subunit [Stellaceae bacterium]
MAAARSEEEPSFRDWVAVFGAILGAFMAVLDIQIVNASLPDIQGGIAASLDEGTWISTAYLVGEIVTIPLTGWLAEVFSTRRYLIGNCILFLGFSMLCGLSTNLPMMIICRAGQGFTGGVFIPMAMTIVLRCLPLSKRPIGLALFGVTATFAPAIGPTIGGWLTDTYSWHWIFYINLLPGALLIWAIAYGLQAEPMRLERLAHGDWLGILCMAVGLGSFITMLEEGERKDWFGNPLIRDTALAAAIFIPAFIALELISKHPFINLRMLKRIDFAGASSMGLVLGLALYGTVYIIPVYLAQIQGYDALQIGEVIMWLGLPQLLIFPLVPLTMRYVDSRVIVGFGLALFAVSCFMDSYLTHDWAIQQLKWSQLVRAAGQPFIITPLSSLAAGSQPPREQAGASAIFNIMRNLGGSVGIAMLSTFLTFREHFHFSVMRDRLTENGLNTAALIGDYTKALAAKTPAGAGATHMQALAQLAGTVRREAFVMAYSDCFFVIGWALVICILALFLVKKPPESAAPAH